MSIKHLEFRALYCVAISRIGCSRTCTTVQYPYFYTVFRSLEPLVISTNWQKVKLYNAITTRCLNLSSRKRGFRISIATHYTACFNCARISPGKFRSLINAIIACHLSVYMFKLTRKFLEYRTFSVQLEIQAVALSV